MLIEFNVENYLSIKNKQTLSLIANKSNELEENIFTVEGNVNLNVLKSAVIYGANAAGKSNVLLAVRAMMDLVIHSASNSQAGEEVPVFPSSLIQIQLKNLLNLKLLLSQRASGINLVFLPQMKELLMNGSLRTQKEGLKSGISELGMKKSGNMIGILAHHYLVKNKFGSVQLEIMPCSCLQLFN